MKKTYMLIITLLITSQIFGQKKVAVYATGSENGINEFVSAYLVDAIVKSSNYRAIERTADFLRELNKEQAYQRSGNVDDNQISEIGKQFGVDLVCVVNIRKMSDKQFVSARLIDVKTATVIGSSKPVIFTLEEIEKASNTVAFELLQKKELEQKQIKEQEKERLRKQEELKANEIEINGVIWATKNVGAFDASDYGNFYTWREAQNVCPDGWRLPTQKEFESLKNSGSTWTTQNGKNGRKFGNSNNFLFLPAAGWRDEDSQLYRQNSGGEYWSSTPINDRAYSLSFSNTSIYEVQGNCYGGCSVRCVKK